MVSPKHKCSYCHKWFDNLDEHMCDKKLKDIRKKRNEYKKKYNKNATVAQKVLKTSKWKRLRANVISADGGVCQRCLIKYNRLTFTDLEVHHIVPRIESPDLAYDMNNLVTLCKECNLELGINGIDFEWTPEKRDSHTSEFHF